MLVFAAMLALVGAAHATDKPIVPRTEVAIGLPVLDQGLSLWLVRPKTMVGVEFDAFEFDWFDRWPASFVEKEENVTYHIYAALTVKRILSQGPLYKFAYLSVYRGHRENKWEVDYKTWGYAGLDIGLGGLWRPMEKVSVALRQGLALKAQEDRYTEFPNQAVSDKDMNKDSFSIRLPKTRLLVLIHF